MNAVSISRVSAQAISPENAAAKVTGQQLPEPTTDCPNTEDLTAMLMMLEQKSAASQTRAAVDQIKLSATKAKEALAAQAEARRAAAEAAEDGGFWDDVASVATTVATVGAAAAVIVGTGGMSTPVVLAIAGASMSSSSALLKATGNDGQLASWLGTGGMICGLAAGGYGIGSAAMGVSGSLQTANAASNGFTMVSGGARIAGGGAGLIAAQYHRDEADSSIDAKAKGFEAKRAKEDSRDALTEIQQIARSAQETIGEILELQQKIQQSKLSMARNIGVRA